jgi:LPS sulfotransferase NodH
MLGQNLKRNYWAMATGLRRLRWGMNAGAHLAQRPEALAGAHVEHRNFMILTHPRSGSTLLADGLNSLPSIVSYGELFTPNYVDYMVSGYRDTQVMRYLRRKFPARFLSEFVYGPYSPHIRAVGFKLFPEHFDYKPEFLPGRRWLLENPELVVLRLVRRNLLKYYVSLELARHTKVWRIREPSRKAPEMTIRLDPEKAEREFIQRSTRDEAYRTLFAKHQILDLTYEDLEIDSAECFRRVLAFLGLEPQPVKVGLHKQETRALPEIIENYDELRRRWTGTRWETFLDD